MTRFIVRIAGALFVLLSVPATLVLALRPVEPHPLLTFARWTQETGAFQPVLRDLDSGYEYHLLGDVWGEMPIWSPDGNWLVYSQRLQGFSDVYLYNLPTSRHSHVIRSLTPSRPVWSPAASPRGTRVLVQRGSQAVRYFYVAEVTATMLGVMQFIDTGRFDVMWSPDGERIIYRTTDDDDLLVSLSAEYFASDNRLQMRDFIRADRPIDYLAGWIPDSQDLMIMSAPISGSQPSLYRLDLATGTTTLIFENALAGTVPAWSADSSLLAVALVSRPTATEPAAPALFLIDSPGELRRELWQGIVGQLSWTPLTNETGRQSLAFEVVQAENGTPFRGIVVYQQADDALTTLTKAGQFEVQPYWNIFRGRPFEGGAAFLIEGVVAFGLVLLNRKQKSGIEIPD